MKGKVKINNYDEINKYIGSQIKFRRNSLGVTQEELSSYLGVTFQQIQKYENGKNRVSAGSLMLISQFLNVSIAYFFEKYNADSNVKSIEQNNRDFKNFTKLYNQNDNEKIRKLAIETSKLILNCFRKNEKQNLHATIPENRTDIKQTKMSKAIN